MRDSAPNPASKTSAPFAASNSATARTVLANRNRGLLARRKHERQYQHEWDNTKCITNARVVDVEQGSLPGTRLDLRWTWSCLFGRPGIWELRDARRSRRRRGRLAAVWHHRAQGNVQHRRPALASLRVEVHKVVDSARHIGRNREPELVRQLH